MKTISISVVVPTYNSIKTLEKLLKSIREQVYDQKKIEIILADGGSKDSIQTVAKKYNAKFVLVTPQRLQSAEYNRAFGAHKAKNEILAFFDHDNILDKKDLLKKLVVPFEHANVTGVETLFYTYSKKLSALDRYFALFGVNDPLAFYLKKADRQSYLHKQGYHLMGKVKECASYYLVEFKKSAIPTLGSNGFLVRRNILFSHADVRLPHFYHIDVNVDLIRKNYNTYAFIKEGITHISGHNDVFSYLWRRMLYMKKYYFDDHSKRRYSLVEKKDVGNLLLFILLSITFVIPIIDATRGYRQIRDTAWFLHPIMCFGIVVLYGYTYIVYLIKKIV